MRVTLAVVDEDYGAGLRVDTRYVDEASVAKRFEMINTKQFEHVTQPQGNGARGGGRGKHFLQTSRLSDGATSSRLTETGPSSSCRRGGGRGTTPSNDCTLRTQHRNAVVVAVPDSNVAVAGPCGIAPISSVTISSPEAKPASWIAQKTASLPKAMRTMRTMRTASRVTPDDSAPPGSDRSRVRPWYDSFLFPLVVRRTPPCCKQ